MKDWKRINESCFSEINARERAFGLADEGTFTELLGPRDRFSSPHLKALGAAIEFDDGIITGIGLIGKHIAFISSMEGKFIGGAIGEVGGAKLVAELRLAMKTHEMLKGDECRLRRPLVIISFETGGVRLHEANAGLLAHAEVMDAIQDLRRKVPVVTVIGSKIGCFGGMGFVAASADAVIMSEVGRLGLTGPEVIEQEVGKEEFDASDKSLIYRTTGGRHKYITRDCNFLVDDKTSAFREVLKKVAGMPMEEIEYLRRIGSAELVEKQIAFAEDAVCSGISDSIDLWRKYGNKEPEKLPEIDIDDFLKNVRRRPLD
ncbi:MAG: biotin-independent malonate decarboxylase subunit beta [Synergistes jonesii]|uniref:biotin-independent malonate decarboxylase subunit beta n=1 Tax=Synergistes jonesii TaxID=2754 RepID=UPI002A7660B4|nr:biotin-independent malonate decarboxylase subunit beta [Synergistes jonesii]MDY2984053.1 biotin-independent malonate decarboxylase subunit beta [Synergistes jonesii]